MVSTESKELSTYLTKPPNDEESVRLLLTDCSADAVSVKMDDESGNPPISSHFALAIKSIGYGLYTLAIFLLIGSFYISRGKFRSDNTSTVSESNFLNLYEQWAPVCTADGVNIVLNRRDYLNIDDKYSERRPWSLQEDSYKFGDDSNSGKTYCDSVPALLDSLKYGKRVPSTREANATVFQPAFCSYEWYSPSELCEISSRFSDIIFYGDSLSRHVTQAMFMLWTNDLQYGGLPRMSRQKELYDDCICDGQFSEHKVCRNYASANMFTLNDPRSYGLCYNDHNFRFLYSSAKIDVNVLCNNDTRPKLLIMQAGVHLGAKSQKVIETFIDPMMNQLRYVASTCPYKNPIFVYWTGLNVETRLLDAKYPHQSRENAVVFNEQTSSYVKANYSISSLDFWNATYDAPTSDGFHYLSEVNLIKAMYVFNLLDLLTSENLAKNSYAFIQNTEVSSSSATASSSSSAAAGAADS